MPPQYGTLILLRKKKILSKLKKFALIICLKNWDAGYQIYLQMPTLDYT